MVDTHILVQVFGEELGKRQVQKRTLFLENNKPSLKAEFSSQVKTSMKSTFYKCGANVTPVTNPTPMSKSGK